MDLELLTLVPDGQRASVLTATQQWKEAAEQHPHVTLSLLEMTGGLLGAS